MTWQLTIPRPTPSRNEFYHKHWRVEHTAKAWWKLQLSMLVLAHRVPPATGKRTVMIERYGKRKLDVDNFFGGFKIVLDAMRSAGLIKDDNETYLELLAHQRKLAPRQAAYTVITLEDCT